MSVYRIFVIGVFGLLLATLAVPPGAADDTNPKCLSFAGQINKQVDAKALQELAAKAAKADCSLSLRAKIDERMGAPRATVEPPPARSVSRVTRPLVPPVGTVPLPPPPENVAVPKKITCPMEDAVGWIDITRGTRGDMFAGSTQPAADGRNLLAGEVIMIPVERPAKVHPFEYACELATECQWAPQRVSGRFEVVRIVTAGRPGSSQRLQVCIRPVR